MSQESNKKKMIVLSLDAFGEADLEYARTLPNFKYLIDGGALVTDVKSVYPTLTYMCHNSIATGLFPARHGVINNLKFRPGHESLDWYWFDRDVRGQDFFDITKRAGYTTASLLWPSTGRHPNIDYNLAEIFPTRKWHNQVAMSLFAGNPLYTFELDRLFGHLRHGVNQPDLDEFLCASMLHTLEKYQPDFMTLHYLALDDARHKYGVHSIQARQAIDLMDEVLGKLIAKLIELGIYDDTIIVALGDHYQIDVHTELRLNPLFIEQGWDGVVIANEAGGACYVYVDTELVFEEEVAEFLSEYDRYFDAIYQGDEIAGLGADPKATFLIEAKAGYYFSNAMTGPFRSPADNYRAVHGYHPGRPGYQTMFFMNGPGIKAGVELSDAWLVDEGPTFMHALGLSYDGYTDGRVIEEIFE